jgi:hypothetical protein
MDQDPGFPEWPKGPVATPARRLSRLSIGANMSFAIYLAGVLILLGGMIYGAALLGMPGDWIAVCSIVALGISVLTGVAVTRHKDPA